MSLINREALYEKACDLEAQALAYVGKIANDETKIEEWRIWSAILAERTAFKHDIFDAPEVKPEPKWIPFDEQQPEYGQEILVTIRWHESGEEEYFVQFDTYFDDATLDSNFKIGRDAFAWMPKPEPYREEGDQDG